ncbi:hypothetical protein STEG23_010125 [Scotinomys teguina]
MARKVGQWEEETAQSQEEEERRQLAVKKRCGVTGPRSTRTPSHRKLPQLHPRTQEHPDAVTPQGPKSTRTPSHHKDPGTPDTIRLGGPRCNQTTLDQENPEVPQTSLDQEIPEAPIIL